MDESCHTREWVMSCIWMSRVTHINESCPTYEWVLSHIWMSHVMHTSKSCHTHGMSHVTHINGSCHTHDDWAHIRDHGERTATYMKESCRTYEWDMSHVWMGHVTRMNESVTHMKTYSLWTATLTTHSNDACHMCLRVMSHICTHIHEGSRKKVSNMWLIHMCDSFICVTHAWVMSHIGMSHVTHVNESCHTYEWVMSHILMIHVT